MRYAIILLMTLVSFSSFAGIGGGGVGPRPTNLFSQNVDLVRTLEINNGTVKFLYKPFDQKQATLKTVDLHEINDLYFAALSDSQKDKEWIAIPLQ